MARRGPASPFESETFGQDASFHLEQPIGAMSISPSGRDVVLASKEGLHIIDLDSPYSPPRYLPHRTPWEVADVQWSPFASRDYWVISTSNQKALVWNLQARSWQDSVEFVLHGHTRAITDINFSAHNPDVLATCAVDSFVHCWDLRAAMRPVNSFSDWFAGATQVKWSRQDEHIIASAHDKYLHIWDDRHGAYPLRTIQAHGTKIYGIDWNRHHPNKIVTCSLDKTIKFWDFDNSYDQPERVIETTFPVWRARHTPFGWGLLAMPQRGSSNLHLYDRRTVHGELESGRVRPVATFRGHEGQVKEFLWRSRGTISDNIDNRDFQLVTWGTDGDLRLHALDPEVYLDIGYEQGKSKVQRLNFTRKGAIYRTFRDEPNDTDSPTEQTPRSETFPRQSFFQSRPRASTNVGMNRVPVSQFRGWVAGNRQAQRSGMHGRGNNRQTADPIAWLKNVKIFSWDPDTIAEEIRQVGEKFKKVEFESVDIPHRKAVMSLQAPWGEEQSQIYLRVEMRFPKLYPRGANAVLSLQKTGALDDATHKHLATELQTISETYASRKRGCLEAVLRYLLREQNLEQIVAWVLGESISDSKVLDPSTIPADDSSSDDDDQMETARGQLDASANMSVPIPKGCGAVWSETGKLVCFFPTRSKEPVSLLGTLGVKDLEEYDSNRLFEGFGRLHSSSPAHKMTGGMKTADDDTASDTSESSWKSSSSSSASFETEQNVRGGSSFRLPVTGLQHQSRSPDRSMHSTAGGQKLAEAPRTSTISMHAFESLLPSKRELAEDYMIFGDAKETCKHNAGVAESAALDDLASVWMLMGLVLDDSVPLEVLPDLSHTTAYDISIIARSLTRVPKSAKQGIELGNGARGRTRWGNHPLGSSYLLPALFDHFERLGDVQMLAMMSCFFAPAPIHGSMRGWSPSAPGGDAPSKCLGIRSDYFPSKAVARSFFRNEVVPEGYILVDSVSAFPKIKSHLAENTQALHSQRRPNIIHSPGLARQASQMSSRAHSFTGDDMSDHLPLYSTTVSVSTSPEGNRMSHKPSSSVAHSSAARASLSALTQSYSNSPPNHPSSSATNSSIKRYSPSGSLAPAWVSSSIFGGQGGHKNARASIPGSEVASQDSHESGRLRSSLSSINLRRTHKDSVPLKSELDSCRSLRSITASGTSDLTQRNEKKPPQRKRIKTRLFNQDKFDLEGYARSPLLDPVLERKCRNYRASYAHLLDVWQLHIQRAEIQKFDHLNTRNDSSSALQNRAHALTAHASHPSAHHTATFLERPPRKSLPTSQLRDLSPRGLVIHRCCPRCSEPLGAIEKNGIPIGWHCVNTLCTSSSTSNSLSATKPPKRSVCAICNRSVSGLSIPCLQCGHLTCFTCAQGWFGGAVERVKSTGIESRRPSEDTPPSSPLDPSIRFADLLGREEDLANLNEHQTCPTGCGCPCALISKIDVPEPPLTPPFNHDNGEYSESSQSQSQGHSRGGSSSGGAAQLQRSSSVLIPPPEPGSSDAAALTALLALTQSHQRTKSATAATSARSKASSVSMQAGQQPRPQVQYAHPIDPQREQTSFSNASSQALAIDDDVRLNPWAGSKLATLGRGIGAGLSRGLASKASDATIRRAK
ncbi:uncharacterized protein A1O9_03405 [Exophiala aquamarina CBS 119918]|uniref:Uncharacterized protein n=1 Tax=Exophiala aquamarina CBS 119918 TaxID=1182545 RepID=A0A072PP30_9EURO|nr:uncharacterized protein A1O9_03405 [Exophiala aquamarina CBS 119918]KEF61834.1 hypothetical protein A1O9_03405 [Exophiala aquamarina CBS 119918]